MHAAADLPRRHWLTVEDCYRMAEVGILDPEARVELIDGEIIDMAPPGSPHAAAVHYLNEVFVRAVQGRATVRVQNPGVSASTPSRSPTWRCCGAATTSTASATRSRTTCC
jgi:hypothetical protein